MDSGNSDMFRKSKGGAESGHEIFGGYGCHCQFHAFDDQLEKVTVILSIIINYWELPLLKLDIRIKILHHKT